MYKSMREWSHTSENPWWKEYSVASLLNSIAVLNQCDNFFFATLFDDDAARYVIQQVIHGEVLKIR